MTEYTNELNGDSPHELERMTARIAEDGEIHDLIGVTVQNTVSQYHSLLRNGLEQEVERILREFKGATADIEMIVTNRVKSRLQDMVRQEVQRIFDAALSSTNESLFGSIEKPLEEIRPEENDDSAQLPIEERPQFEAEISSEPESTEDIDNQVHGEIEDELLAVDESPSEEPVSAYEPDDAEEEDPADEDESLIPAESHLSQDETEEIG